MSQINKRPVEFSINNSPKKYKSDNGLDNLKLQLEKILKDCPVNHTNPLRGRMNKHPRENLIYLTGVSGKQRGNSSSAKLSSDLSENDLKVLLQNFYKLEGKEQQILIAHLKKLEENKPDLVEDLKSFVRVNPPPPECEDKDASDYDLNDLDDLDDILQGEFTSDSESDDDSRLVSQITTKLKEVESTKNIIEILENTIEKNKIKNITLLPKILPKQEIKKDDQLIKVAIVKKQEINKDRINKSLDYKGEKSQQNWKKERRKFNSSFSREMQAQYFGYRNYEDMVEYLKNTGTGLYCGMNYVSFSDN